MTSTEDDIEQQQGVESTVSYVETVRDQDKEYGEPPEEVQNKRNSDDMTYKTSEGVETMLYDEAPPTCWSRFRGEWKLKFFELSETDEAMINVHRSFAPPPFWRTFILKTIITGWTIAILLTDMLSDEWEPVSYYFIYLAHWSLAITILYLLVSFANTVFGVPEQRPYEDIPGFMVRFAWGLYPTAAVAQMMTTILFWIVQFDPNEPVTYKMIMTHGGIMILVLLEGRFINRIPVRQKHLLFPMIFIHLFILWTVLHDFAGLGNPYVEDSDAIYDALDWKENWKEAAVTSAVLAFGVTPLLFLNIWLLSIWSFPFHFDGLNRHHYYLEEKEKEPSWWESLMSWNWKGKHEKGQQVADDSNA